MKITGRIASIKYNGVEIYTHQALVAGEEIRWHQPTASGRALCGVARTNTEADSFATCPENVTCPKCLEARKGDPVAQIDRNHQSEPVNPQAFPGCHSEPVQHRCGHIVPVQVWDDAPRRTAQIMTILCTADCSTCAGGRVLAALEKAVDAPMVWQFNEASNDALKDQIRKGMREMWEHGRTAIPVQRGSGSGGGYEPEPKRKFAVNDRVVALADGRHLKVLGYANGSIVKVENEHGFMMLYGEEKLALAEGGGKRKFALGDYVALEPDGECIGVIQQTSKNGRCIVWSHTNRVNMLFEEADLYPAKPETIKPGDEAAPVCIALCPGKDALPNVVKVEITNEKCDCGFPRPDGSPHICMECREPSPMQRTTVLQAGESVERKAVIHFSEQAGGNRRTCHPLVRHVGTALEGGG